MCAKLRFTWFHHRSPCPRTSPAAAIKVQALMDALYVTSDAGREPHRQGCEKVWPSLHLKHHENLAAENSCCLCVTRLVGV